MRAVITGGCGISGFAPLRPIYRGGLGCGVARQPDHRSRGESRAPGEKNSKLPERTTSTSAKPISIDGAVDYVLHFASPASPFDYLKFPIETMRVGSVGTQNALDLARAKKAKFFLASTSECYGDPDITPQPETYWGHVNSIGPRAVYDEAKRFAEAMTMAYHRYHGVDTHIVRIFNTYGPRMRLNDGRALPNFVHQALTGKPITVYGDGKQTRSFCYVSDLIDGIYRLCDVGRTPADEHRQSAGDHDPGIRRKDSRAFRERAENHLRAASAGRSKAALPGYQQGEDDC